MFKRLKKLFKRKHNMHVTLKSGKTIVLRCTDLTINKNGNNIISWNVEGCPEYFYIRLDEIAAITKG